MAKTKAKRHLKLYAVVAVAVVIAFVLYQRNKASSVSATDQAVPLTPSSYFYPGSGASYSSGGGTAGSSSGNVGQPANGGGSSDKVGPHPGGIVVLGGQARQLGGDPKQHGIFRPNKGPNTK